MVVDLTTFREQHKALVTKRNALEDAYRVFATEEGDMKEEDAQKKIAKARSAPQKNKRLQLIHEAQKTVVAKEAEITEVEGDLATVRKTQLFNEVKKQEAKVPKAQ